MSPYRARNHARDRNRILETVHKLQADYAHEHRFAEDEHDSIIQSCYLFYRLLYLNMRRRPLVSSLFCDTILVIL